MRERIEAKPPPWANAFQKKAHKGIATDQRDLEFIRKRLGDAEQIDKAKREQAGRKQP